MLQQVFSVECFIGFPITIVAVGVIGAKKKFCNSSISQYIVFTQLHLKCLNAIVDKGLQLVFGKSRAGEHILKQGKQGFKMTGQRVEHDRGEVEIDGNT